MLDNYFFTEEHELFRSSFRDYLKKEVIPHIDEWEEAGETPKKVWEQMGDLGYLGIDVDEKYGGSQLDFMYHLILTEELSRVFSGGFAAAIMAHVSLAMIYLNKFGSEELKAKYLPKSVSGEAVGCLAITEPVAGSDVAGIRTKAVKDGDEYILNGSKIFITNGVYSDYLIIAAKTDMEAKAAGITLFVVDRNTKGISARKLKKLGWKASDTGEIFLEDVRVPADQILGYEGMGFYYIMQNFALERLVLAIGAVTASEEAIQYTLQYMSERKAFGRPINRFQVLRHRMAQLSAEVEQSKYFNYTIAKAFSQDENVVKQCAMAKLLSTELSDKVMTECLQCFGGYGYMEEYKMARMLRDSRLGTIGGGTSEIMCELIAKMVVDDVDYKRVE